MAEFPIIPIKVAYLLADTVDMDAAEFGAYVRILLSMWINGGRLPVDALQKTTGLSRHKWQASRARICRPLTIIEGVASQKRLEDTRLKVKAKRAKRVDAAKKRWYPQTPAMHMQSMEQSDAMHMQKPMQCMSTQTKQLSKSFFFGGPQSTPIAPQEASDESELSRLIRAKGWK